MEPRRDALAVLHDARPEFDLCRDVEADCHAAADTLDDYIDLILRAEHNLRVNPRVGREVVHASDADLAKGTIVARIEEERLLRAARFDEMLAEKYSSLDDQAFQAIVRCRKCQSVEVTWEEKQTRSADEGCTVFVVCNRCSNRWVLR